MSKKKKNVNLIDELKSELSDLSNQFDDAVSLITRTVARLTGLNGEIDTKIARIEECEKELSNTKRGLVDARSKNDNVIDNFSRLLAGGEVTVNNV